PVDIQKKGEGHPLQHCAELACWTYSFSPQIISVFLSGHFSGFQPPRAQRGVGWSELLARFREFACYVRQAKRPLAARCRRNDNLGT
ncbi:MAG TPA: hypothetical protein VGK56_13065, partial [Anaerolineales bacterium]